MDWNDYIEEVRTCAQDWMGENYKHVADYADVHDAMMDEDAVTGNGSGSFTYDRVQAAENIAGILDDGEVLAKFTQLGYTEFPDDPEVVDVVARMLALDELHDELEEWFYQNR